MNLKYIEAKARKYKELDKRLSLDLCLAEATLEQIIIALHHRGRIPQKNLIDKS